WSHYMSLVTGGSHGWSGWQSLGGQFTSHLSSCSFGPNRIDVVGRGTDNNVWHNWWDGATWQANWEAHIIQAAGAPAIAACNTVANRLDIYTVATDGNCYHQYWAGSGWSAWENLGHPSGVTLVGGCAGASWGANRFDVWAVGTDQVTYHNWWTGS